MQRYWKILVVAAVVVVLGGALALYRAAFRQGGVIEVFDVADLSDCARAFLAGRLPRGNRIAVVTISGGAGVLMADHCTEAGMVLPRLTMRSLERLRPVVPGFAALDNHNPTINLATWDSRTRRRNVLRCGT